MFILTNKNSLTFKRIDDFQIVFSTTEFVSSVSLKIDSTELIEIIKLDEDVSSGYKYELGDMLYRILKWQVSKQIDNQHIIIDIDLIKHTIETEVNAIEDAKKE